jgi:enamine deaminase RidA (YjgF/YER057c/UK114 family)
MPQPVFTNPDTLLTPPGPYSQVAQVGDLVFVSGQVGADRENNLVGPGIGEQCEQALRNIRTALESVHLTLDNVVKVTIYVPYPDDMEELVPHMDRVFPDHFPNGFPPSTQVIVQRLVDPGLKIEIEAVAHV